MAQKALAGYADDGSHHAFLVCVANDILHLDPVIITFFSLSPIPAGDGIHLPDASLYGPTTS